MAAWRPGFLFFLALLAALTPSGFCFAGHGDHFDGTTRCRWSRTWNGPNSIWRPLTPYFVPRPADPCLYGGYGRSCYEDASFQCGCGFAVEGEGRYFSEGAAQCDGEELTGYGELPALSAGMERLGQIPNDMGISGRMPGAPAQPGR
jgi:hypothetical protein